MASPALPRRARDRLAARRGVSTAVAWQRAHPSLVSAACVALLWAGASVVLAVWYSGRIRDWAVMTDELQYAKLATAIGDTGSPLPSIHDTAVSLSNQLYPLLIAPFYGTLSPPTAFRAAHVLNAVVMTSAAIPAYLLGRQVLSRPWAFAVAALSIVVPWMVLTGFLMSEAAAYPAFLWAVLGLQLAIVGPSIRRDFLAVGALGLAFLARAQFAALAVVLPLAVLGNEIARELERPGAAAWWRKLLAGTRNAVYRHPVLAALYAVGIVVAVTAAALESVGGLLGAYSVTLEEGSLLPMDTWAGAARHIDSIAIGCGLVPLVLGGGWMVATVVRARSEVERALAALLLTTVVVLTFETASYNVRFGGAEVVRDRYLFYVVPLLLVGAAAALSSAPRRPVALGGAAIAVFVAATIPLLDFTPFDGLSVDSPTTVLNDTFGDLSGSFGDDVFVALLALGVGAVVVLGLLFAPRLPLALVLFAAVAVFSVATLRTAADRALTSTGPSGRPLAGPPGVVLDWVDSVVPSEGDVALVPFPVSTSWHLSAIRWWDVEFWNESVTQTYVSEDGQWTYTPFPTRTLDIDWATGAVPDTTDAPAYVVSVPADPRFQLRGASRAENVGLVVSEVDRPYRALWSSRGLDPDGWTRRGRPATIRLFGREGDRAEMVEVEMSVQSPGSDPALYRITTPAEGLSGPLFKASARTESVSVCVPARSTADITITGWSNARIAGPPLEPEVTGTRAVGVGITSIAVRPTGIDCEAPRPE